MRRVSQSLMSSCLFVLLASSAVRADDARPFTRAADVIYGRKDGLALTMDVFAPKEKANGLGIIFVVSGGWRSHHAAIRAEMLRPFLERGYTVFAVVHGTQPRFTIPEIVADLNRAVRFIRYRAKDYRIDPEHLGITGASAGGHLSLMVGTAGDKGNARANDPVERVSSRVQAVACFFPPTDFLNWGKPGDVLDTVHMDRRFRAAVDFKEFDPEKRIFVRITDGKKIKDILGSISPMMHVSADDAPTLIIHGDKDTLVPLQQSETIVDKFKEVGVPAKLIVKKGCGHGWLTILKDTETCCDWFDRYLKVKEKAAQ